jgi:PhnB protein
LGDYISHITTYSDGTHQPPYQFQWQCRRSIYVLPLGIWWRICSDKSLQRHGSDEFPVAESEANKVMHIALPIGKNLLMGNDVPEIMGPTNENENRSKISISAESKEEAEALFNGLSAGGNVEMPLDESPWGSYFAMFRDKYGIEWMVDYDPKYKGQL